MKQTLFLITVIVLLSVYLTSCDGKSIMAEQLPTAALNYIDENYPDSKIDFAMKDFELFSTFYEVTLDNGTELIFNSNGEPTRVDG